MALSVLRLSCCGSESEFAECARCGHLGERCAVFELPLRFFDGAVELLILTGLFADCLLYTSDAADEL